MSSYRDTASLPGSLRAIRMGYARKYEPNLDQIIHPPWTLRDIGDMHTIHAKTTWLLDEVKAGFKITEDRHGWTIRNIIFLGNALDRKEQEYLAKAGFDPNQPRIPRGHTDGGQWTDSSGSDNGSVTLPMRGLPPIARPHRKPPNLGKPPSYADSPYYDPETGIYDPPINPTFSPLDIIGLGSKPITAAIGWSVRAAYNAARARSVGRQFAQDFLQKQGKEALTDHGSLRVGQRLRSQEDVNEAVESAIKTGKITNKIGKYGTRQFHYQGENGLTVIIETEGRNAGKVVTTFGKNPGGTQ